ncbi:hypothetical protein FQN57_002928 [Myotisia sp. PD_48]|nr:hypothetical protein FQN57_002928 [Myotisia sp. PD_48]
MNIYQASFVTLLSTVLRIISYGFLRWIPGHHGPPIVLTTLCLYLGSIWAFHSASSSEPVSAQPRGPDKKVQTSCDWIKEQISKVISLLTGVPCSTSKVITWITVGINVLLGVLVFDLVFRGIGLYPTHDLRFSRIGYVSSDTAKILIREPDQGNLPLRIAYKRTDTGPDAGWIEAGKVLSLNESTDYTIPITLHQLEESTRYQYLVSNALSGEFVTAAALGSPGSNQLSFWTSSCIKPNFPYNFFSHPLRIRGIETLAKVADKIKQQFQPAFMLFLGDFIYIDVPLRLGSSVAHYREEYRRVYSSPSWHKGGHPPMDIPWIHTIDDHEIANDWHQGNLTAPYPAAFDPYQHYHVSVNPPIPSSPHAIPSNTSYFAFTRGPASFFIIDSRTYRSPPSFDGSTMLGSAQLESLLEYISQPEPEGVKWKIISSSVPFTKNWQIGTKDTWGGYLKERRVVFEAMWRAEAELGVRIVLLSGDRHEFGATRFHKASTQASDSLKPLHELQSGPGPGIHEFCVGPLSQFYLPTRSYRQLDDQDISIQYVPDGNFKFGAVDIETLPDGESVLIYSLYVDGELAWKYKLSVPIDKNEFPPGQILVEYVKDWPQLLADHILDVTRTFGTGSDKFKLLNTEEMWLKFVEAQKRNMRKMGWL